MKKRVISIIGIVFFVLIACLFLLDEFVNYDAYKINALIEDYNMVEQEKNNDFSKNAISSMEKEFKNWAGEKGPSKMTLQRYRGVDNNNMIIEIKYVYYNAKMDNYYYAKINYSNTGSVKIEKIKFDEEIKKKIDKESNSLLRNTIYEFVSSNLYFVILGGILLCIVLIKFYTKTWLESTSYMMKKP